MAAALRAAGLRASSTSANEKINAKVREHSLAACAGDRGGRPQEAEQRTVALRRLGGEAQEVLPLDEAVARLAAEAMPPDLQGAIRTEKLDRLCRETGAITP